MQSLRIVFLVLLISTLIVTENITLSCGDCRYTPTEKCPYSKCYFFEGKDINFETCTHTKCCPFVNPIQLDVNKCLFDLKGDPCNSNLCFIALNSPFVFKHFDPYGNPVCF